MIKERKIKGFTLMELLIVIVIIGIIATSVTFAVKNFVIEKKSEEKVVAFWTELMSFKALAQRDGCRYIVKLHKAPTTNYYTVYKDINNTYVGDAGEDTYSGFMHKSESGDGYLSFEVPEGLTAANGFNIEGVDPFPDNGELTEVKGEWLNYTPPTVPEIFNTIVFESDNLGTITDGMFYLRNTAVPHIGYAIVKAPNTNSIKLYKWNGSTWYEM